MALQNHIYLCRVRLPDGNKKPRHYFLSRQLNILIVSFEGKKIVSQIVVVSNCPHIKAILIGNLEGQELSCSSQSEQSK